MAKTPLPFAKQQVENVINAVNATIRGAFPALIIQPPTQRLIEADVQNTVMQVLDAASDTLKSQIISNGSQQIGSAIGTIAGTALGGVLTAEIGGLGVALGAPMGPLLGEAANNLDGPTIQAVLGVAVDNAKKAMS